MLGVVSSDQIPVRRAVAADSGRIAELLHDFNTEFSQPTPGVAFLRERIAGLLGEEAVVVLLAAASAQGLALLRFRPSIWEESLDAYLEELYVVPERRGVGIGRALLAASIEAARGAGARRLELGTAETDTAARGLYESCGLTNREGGPDGPLMMFYERDL